MFRRLWSGLPKDPVFPDDLEKLGYFVNDDDEIRNIENPKYYFKYFSNKNMYWNDRQRFAFDTAIGRIVHARLAQLGLEPVRLPLGAAPDEPHVPVLTTGDLTTARRIVLFVGETAQDLGILAYRVVGGAGGINKGSLVSTVKALRDGKEKEELPAIVIFNPGQLFWWPEGRRVLSLPARLGMPRPSAAHYPPRTLPGVNTVPGHETADEHVASVFHDLLDPLLAPNKNEPRLTAIAIAGGADALEGFLDQPDHWRHWGPYMDSLVLLGGLYEAKDVKTDGFREFLRKRARAYIPSTAPVDMPMTGPDGNDQTMRSTHFGCPVHSSGTSWLTELMFIDAQDAILAWGEAVASNPEYENPQMEITYAEGLEGETASAMPTSSGWEAAKLYEDGEKGSLVTEVDSEDEKMEDKSNERQSTSKEDFTGEADIAGKLAEMTVKDDVTSS